MLRWVWIIVDCFNFIWGLIQSWELSYYVKSSNCWKGNFADICLTQMAPELNLKFLNRNLQFDNMGNLRKYQDIIEYTTFPLTWLIVFLWALIWRVPFVTYSFTFNVYWIAALWNYQFHEIWLFCRQKRQKVGIWLLQMFLFPFKWVRLKNIGFFLVQLWFRRVWQRSLFWWPGCIWAWRYVKCRIT